ncbi:MAG: carboxypeptidase-like regulatory domain-containing protein [Planctomycetota bacterium]
MNGKSLVVLLLLLGLAVFGFLAFRSMSGGEQEPAPPPVHEQKAQPGQNSVVDAHLATSGPAEAAGGGVGEGERTAAALPSGAGDRLVTIRGRLVDAQQQPCTDARLRYALRPDTSALDFAPNPPDDPQHDVPVGRDGRFAFAIAADRAARLELVDDQRLFEREPGWVRGAEGDRDLGDLAVLSGAAISGIVQDAAGRPMADVNVATNFGELGLGFGIGKSASTTDAEGRFRIARLRAGKYTLRTASAKFLPTTQVVEVEKGQQLADVVLVVAVGKAIAGQVVDDLGRPVAGIKVGAKRNETRPGIEVERFSNDEAAVTDANGFFTLSGIDGESASVRARGTGYATAIAANVPVGSSNLVLRVDRLAAVEGVLVSADGRPIAGSKVRARAQHRGAAFDLGIEGLSTDRGGSAVTAADGSFHVDNVTPGTVDLEASGDGHLPVLSKGIAVLAAQTVKGVRLVAERGAAVQVTVFDVDGKPLANAKVAVGRPNADSGSGNGGFVTRSRRVEADGPDVQFFGDDRPIATGTTDKDGKALLAGLPAERLEVGATHPDFAAAKPQTFGLLANTTIDVDLAMRPPARVEVRVADSGGGKLSGARVRLEGPLGLPESKRSEERTDDDGFARFGPIVAGDYKVELLQAPAATKVGNAMVMFGDDGGTAIGGTAQQCRARAGETTKVDLRMPLLTRLYGTVTGVDGPVADCVVELNGSAAPRMQLPGLTSGGRSATTDAQGQYEIRDVEPGDYTISFGREHQLVKAESPCTVAKDLPELRQDLVLRLGKVRVQAVDADGGTPIAGAEVEIAPQKAAGATGDSQRGEVRMAMVTIATSDGAGAGNDDATMMTIGTQRAKTGADGYAEILDVPVGTYEVRLTHKKHAPATRRDAVVAELQTTEVGRVDMAQAGRVTGTVVGADGKPPQLALVSWHKVGENDENTVPAMDGAFRLDSLAAGRYALRARQPGPPGAPGAAGEEVEVEVKGGETATAQLKLPAR